MEVNSLITLLREIAIAEPLNPPWDLFLFGSSNGRDRIDVDSDVDLILVYMCGDEEEARKFRLRACRRAWDILKMQLDITLLSKEEEKDVNFVSAEGAARILGSSESQ